MEQEIGAFFHSSLSCAGAEIVQGRLQSFLADTFGHFGLAVLLVTLVVIKGWPRAWFWGALGLLVLKEGIDISADQTALVIADSAWDVLTYGVGAAVALWALGSPRVGDE